MIYPKIYSNFAYLLNRKTSKVIVAWLIILFVFIITVLIIVFNYKYHTYQTYLGYIKNIGNSLKPTFYVPVNEVGNIIDYKLLVDDEMMEFKILSISSDYYLIDNQPFYEVVIETKLDDKYLIENNIINLIFEKHSTTLFQEIRKDFKL